MSLKICKTPLLPPYVSLKGSEYYHQHITELLWVVGHMLSLSHGSQCPNAERGWSKEKMCSYIRQTRSCVNAAWATQHLVAEAVFLC